MRLVALLTATWLLLGVAPTSVAATIPTAPPQLVSAQQVMAQPLPAESTKKKRKKKASASATPTPMPSSTPTPRSAADEEGDRWLMLAAIAGGGLLVAVLVFFALGALLRRRPRSGR